MTPDNGFYYHAAYIVVAIVYSLYTVSLITRRRALERRLAAMQASPSGNRSTE